MNATHRTAAPGWASTLARLNQWLMFDLGGGPRPLKLGTVINVFKGATLPVMAGLVAYYQARGIAPSAASWLYLALHGAYGLVWVLKDLTFPDKNWQGRATLPSILMAAAGLSTYWLAGWLVISGTATRSYPLPEPAWLAGCAFLCVLGCTIMIAADVQKFATLQVKRGLITTGMFRRIRHPNYLGEMLIYSSFALVAWHWIPALVLAYFWLGMFAPNMALKEASMSRYPEWADYKQRSWWLVPGLL
ncbi:MAG: DUF1295 domain-containing protein [Myxococcales bacterium]|nr:DUF1295 domain-containing protein [Myxococcales bacterium]